jgi:hypothetical protein
MWITYEVPVFAAGVRGLAVSVLYRIVTSALSSKGAAESKTNIAPEMVRI